MGNPAVIIVIIIKIFVKPVESKMKHYKLKDFIGVANFSILRGTQLQCKGLYYEEVDSAPFLGV